MKQEPSNRPNDQQVIHHQESPLAIYKRVIEKYGKKVGWPYNRKDSKKKK